MCLLGTDSIKYYNLLFKNLIFKGSKAATSSIGAL